MKKFAGGRTRFMIVSLTVHFTRIAVGDCRDGILFYSYHEVSLCRVSASSLKFVPLLMPSIANF